MRILLCSHVFPPHVGGIETVSAILAERWVCVGASVTVVTQTPGDQISKNYKIVRRPPLSRLRSLAKEVDIIFQNNISLRTLVPLLASRKPIVIAHQTWLNRSEGRRGWQDYLKLSILPLCRNIAISKAIAESLPVRSVVIGNPFESNEFVHSAVDSRPKDIVFMGRLVSDKGCDLVLRALTILKAEGICPSFSVIGDGPEMPTLRRVAAETGLSSQVRFCGALREGRGKEVAQHKIMVVPSVWAEPFGVVALEGIAAGCAIAASNTGGLPEAVGPCGLLFPNGNVEALAAVLRQLLVDSSLRESLIAGSACHLQEFHPEAVAKRYLQVFETALNA